MGCVFFFIVGVLVGGFVMTIVMSAICINRINSIEGTFKKLN